MMKRWIAIALTLIMLVGAVPVTAFAQTTQPETDVHTGDMTVQGTNSVGDLLSEDLITYQEESADSAAGGYTIVDLQVEGNTATVEYAVIEQARLVVSIYTEDGLKMLLSGDTLISPEDTVATVTLEGAMPQYFMASAYMVDIYDYSPLCQAYSTPMYTKEMQDLLASDIYDYDQDLVLNLDESTETNFAVYSEDTIVIPYQAGVNTVASIDEELGLYVIENADSYFTSLQEGDVFSYAYGDNEYLIAKVAEIEVDGSTVTILGGDLEMEDVFSHVKMEAEATASDFTVDDSNLEEGITYEGLVQDGVRPFALEGDLEDEFELAYKFLRSEKSVSSENLDIEVKVEGQARLKVKTKIDYYVTLRYQYIQYKTDLTLKIGLTVTGEFTLKFPLGRMGFNLAGCIFIGLTPELQAKFTGKASIDFVSRCTLGFQYDNGTFTNLCTVPNFSFDVELEGSYFFGVDLNPKISVLGGKAAEVELETPFGIEIKSELKRSEIIAGQEDQSSRHACDDCLEITRKFIANVGVKIQFLKMKRLTFSRTFKVVEKKLDESYHSYDFNEKGVGQCPHKEYRVSLQILDAQSRRVPNAQLTAVWKDKDETLDLGTTNEKGLWVDYLCPGTYDLTVTADGKTVTYTVEIEEAGRLFLIHAEQSETDKLLGGINPGTIIEGGDQEISGSCGDNVTYELFPNGLLLIEGTGDMQDFNNAAGTPWADYADQITDIVIDDGVTSIGAQAFAWYDEYDYLIKYPVNSIVIGNDVETIGTEAFIGIDGLTSIELPGSVKRIESSAFADCDTLETVILSNGLEYIGDHAFEGCSALNSIVIPESVTTIGSYTFAWCSGLTELTIPASVKSVGLGVTVGSYNVTAIHVAEGNSKHSSADGILFNKEMTLLDQVPGGFTGTCTIPDSVVTIGQAAFYFSGVTAVVIPDSVLNIGPSAFMYSKVKNVYFLGDAPETIWRDSFEWANVTAYYPADNATWTEDKLQNYNGTITWVAYDPATAPVDTGESGADSGDSIIRDIPKDLGEEFELAVTAAEKSDAPTRSIWGGEYETEQLPDYDRKTAVFSGLVPGEEYLMVAVAGIDTDDLLAADNLLYIAQGEADASGNLRITYVQRVDTDLSYVFACGPSNKNLKDAVITFPTMLATGESQLIEPKVVYGGKTLKEGQDYIIAGTADYTQAGTYTCYIRGIYDYTGTVECKYTVGQLPASGTCGEGLSWNLTEEGVLTISGSGTMDDTAPWSYYREFITQVVVEKGVQSISSGVFSGCTKLAKISFQGNAPAISEDAFAGVTAAAEYPKYDPSWTDDVKGNYGGTMTWTGVEYPCEHTNTQTTGKTDPTCTATGYTGDTVCQDCYKTVSYGTTIGALGHSYTDGFCTACGQAKPLVQVASGKCGMNLRWTLWDNGLLEITGTGQMYGYSKTNTPWYTHRESITSIKIGSGVTSIGTFAFSGCTALKEVVIPDNVKTISGGVFNGCSSLESLTIPFVGSQVRMSTDTSQYPLGYIFGTGSYTGGVSTYQYYYLSSTSNTTYNNYYIPASLKTVTVTGGYLLFGAFYNCKSIENIYVGAGVTNARPNAFRQCAALKGIWVEEGNPNLASDAQGALYSKDMTTLWAVPGGYEGTFVIPDSVTTIESYAFADCTKLTSVAFGSNVQTIKANAFYNCTALETVTLNQGLSKIETEAFYNCTSLKTLEIPSSVTSIGQGALRGCSALESLTIPFVGGSKKTPQATYQYPFGYIFGTASFTGAASTSQPYYSFDLENATVTGYYIPASLKTVTVTGGYLLYGAFYNCKNIENIYVGAGVTNAQSNAFYQCTSLKGIWVEEENPNLASDAQGALYSKDMTTLWAVPGGYEGAFVIPDSVTTIESYAFANCTNLTSVTFGSNVQTIKANAFYSCKALETVTLNQGLSKIEVQAFYNCSMLQALEIPNSVISIGQGALGGCGALESLTIPFVGGTSKTPQDTYQYPFGYIFDFVSYTGSVRTPQTYYGDSLDSTITNSYYIPSSLKTVTVTGGYVLYGAFQNCEYLTAVTLGDDVASIGDYAFQGCAALREISFGGADRIGKYAFSNCTSLDEIVIPATVSYVGDYAFDGASVKTAIIGRADELGYGRSVELGKYLFTSAETVYLGEYVKTVTEATFHTGPGWYCNMLQAIHVDEGNPYYSSDKYGILFNKNKTTLICCPNRFGPSYTIPDSVTTIGYSAFENCLSLKNVTLGEKVSAIESYAFYECAYLQKIYLGDSVRFLGDYAFEDCTQLTTVIMGDGITTIPVGAFNNCSSLRTVAIGHNVRTIANFAFNNCTSLATISIPASVKTLGNVFGDCTKLKEVCFLGGAPTMADNLFYNVTATAYYSFAGGGWKVSNWKDYGGDMGWHATNTPCQHSQSMLYDAKTATCTENGYTGDTLCVGCRELFSEGRVTSATGHSYSSVVTAPTCTEAGYSTYTCRYCDDSYTGDVRPALNHPNTQLTGVVQATCTADGYSGDTLCNTCNTIIATGQVVAASGHSYEEGTCTGCGGKDPDYVKLVEFSGMTMTLGNSLAANFVINTALLEGSDHYAVITKTYADGTQPVSVTIPQSDWKVYSGKLYYFTFTGVNAKEMTDEFTVIVYNAQGRQVSVTYTRTIEDYCYGLITKEEVKAAPDTERLALYTDILNYGAAAQDFFTYNTGNLANKRLTATQQGYATQSVVTEDVRTQGTGYMGSTLSLKNEILMNFVYRNATIDQAAYAVYTFRHHDGGEETVTVPASQFKAYGTSGKYIDVLGMKVADCNQVITVTLYDADGNVLSTSTDSVWSYASRNLSKHEVYSAVLKLADSAYNYFH